MEKDMYAFAVENDNEEGRWVNFLLVSMLFD